ncbi:Uu.00g002090.m01.CDS01 [Anthostomella pinea]|uniref:Uu.00g002090.m01.CDS01 n=1 Tax=Anthostomella pinea TaxID=933095 RepID=A0AAI8VJG8_9PEZI|nr:Uu.00g002090.m01.CDS01 [Anthostomella pinea]
MSLQRALRGSCHCGRNQYIIEVPNGASDVAQILFDSNAGHRVSSATPLSAFLRVPLSWYRSQTFPFFSDESRSNIRRVYSHPDEQHTRRNFCGFCGTPLSYWSEEPRGEAEYIQLTLGSLLTEDLHDLEELGLIPDDSEQDEMDIVPAPVHNQGRQLIGRDSNSIPWFESMLAGSRLGNMQTTRGVRQSHDGRVRVEFEITEWTAGDEAETEMDEAADAEGDASETSSATGKRKRRDVDDGAGATPA